MSQLMVPLSIEKLLLSYFSSDNRSGGRNRHLSMMAEWMHTCLCRLSKFTSFGYFFIVYWTVTYADVSGELIIVYFMDLVGSSFEEEAERCI